LKNRLIIFSTLIFILTQNSFAQSTSSPSLALTDIDFSLSVYEIPDTISTLPVVIRSNDYEQKFILIPVEGKVDTLISIFHSGNYFIEFPDLDIEAASIKVLPGILSIIPPLLAILLALIFRQVILSLILGVYVGAFFIYNFNPLTGLLRLIDTYIINAISDDSHIQILVFT
jgi:hypothetical protein